MKIKFKIFVFLLFCSQIVFAEGRKVEFGKPAVSYSGKYVLDLMQGNDGHSDHFRIQIFSIGDHDMRTLVFTSPDRFEARHRLVVIWDQEDWVWLYSGDIGICYWKKMETDQWERHIVREGDKVANMPEEIRKLLPKESVSSEAR